MVERQRAVPRHALTLNTDGGANQEDRDGADINTIVGQYKRHGTLPGVALTNPLYGDFSASEDLMDVRQSHYEAEDRFNELPAAVRSAAENDWVKFMEMFNDPTQRDLLIEHGLVLVETPVAVPTNSPGAVPAPAPDPTATPTDAPATP